MVIGDLSTLIVEQHALASKFLNRYVIVDFFLPKNVADPQSLSLLLINDGQNLEEMDFAGMLNGLMESAQIGPVLCAGIHAGRDRKNEYGTSSHLDYEGRGAKSEAYRMFILEELLPYVHDRFAVEGFSRKAFAGFSLGGLTAIDLTWRHPEIFSIAGVFSGSLWWRSKTLGDDYNDETDRIMHQLIREGDFHEGLRFYFTTGSLDETADRNHNGIIDSIDDTLDLMKELKAKGFREGVDLHYENFEDGRHDIHTWGRAFPGFLLWSFSI